ncbi:dihydroorotate dehydrogenase electron transfer subunit [Eubacterium aggregans]|uniref:Dihydroorotate dehydrogenase electron transfer subunit n=1 Tax=Eubacterium aggregans TaxID=81409 RepID=A0A1H4CSA7_9FIRM|nr:dihydroorotate dehydrogenase electron transfer subunit [Eubacterium aggregans]SEA63234.1 dihydroorotate dehydrogenase electron transfer subunit [Eubacterium aggregans]
MAVIITNRSLADGIYMMEVAWEGVVSPGQFFMVRAWETDPLLSRPISVHDYQDGVVTFLYQVVGKGTAILSGMEPKNTIQLEGPYGNGFPAVDTPLVAVGGGIGIAPLYYACRKFKEDNPKKKLRVYLGFSNEAYRVEAFDAIADEVVVDVGGIIVGQVDVKRGETFITCGPRVMMDALCQVVPEKNPVYVSLEARMACGMGACLGCSIKTAEGNKKVCKDGPVFPREVLEG